MTLEKYKSKRDFGNTPEPRGKVGGTSGRRPLFVVQKHQASRLHFDLRLEVGGVLASWAVPKGPSPEPDDLRLAMKVEDHPLEYADFEGVIPKGNYGAGTVMVWDSGEYAVKDQKSKKGVEAEVSRGLAGGKLTIEFFGEKMKGIYHLFRKGGPENKEWFLSKKKDEYAGRNYPDENRSVLSGLEMGQIGQAGKVWIPANGLVRGKAPAGQAPERVSPMLATLAKEPFDDPEWIYEIKWDGYRAIGHLGETRLYSRNGVSFKNKFPAIYQAIDRFEGVEAVIDGEVAVLGEDGRADFSLLQEHIKTGKGQALYCVFDLLYLNGKDLRALPLLERKRVLRDMVSGVNGLIKYVDHIEQDGRKFFEIAVENRIEGIMAKKVDSPYREGVRSRDWLKIKHQPTQDAVVAGYTEPRRGRKHFGSLILGVYESNDLVYIGHTGTGFSDTQLSRLKNKFKDLETDECPFAKKPKTNEPAHWLKPKLVCEVKYTEWTGEGLLRHPVFLGLREDKRPDETFREKGIVKKSGPENKIEITNPDKIYWPDEGISKRQMVDFYESISNFILPHLAGRPLSLNRYPDGIAGESFYQKNLPDPPGFLDTVEIRSEGERRTIKYPVCNNKKSLLYLANLGCIEFHSWVSRVGSLENPDFLVLDIDPGDKDYQKAVKTALATKEILDKIGIKAYVKTSGGKGLHIFAPLAPGHTYGQSREFAHLINMAVHRLLPDITTLERDPRKRNSKVYLDYLQNRRGQTMASVYCLRPRPGAPVSTPLDWDEVEQSAPEDFTIDNIGKRLESRGDLWAGLLSSPGFMISEKIEPLTVMLKDR